MVANGGTTLTIFMLTKLLLDSNLIKIDMQEEFEQDWSCGVTVSTLDFESKDPSSNLGRTSLFLFLFPFPSFFLLSFPPSKRSFWKDNFFLPSLEIFHSLAKMAEKQICLLLLLCNFSLLHWT